MTYYWLALIPFMGFVFLLCDAILALPAPDDSHTDGDDQ